VSHKRALGQQRYRLAIEALTFGLAYAAGLCWASVCILASFRPNGLSSPYWSSVPSLRSDTSGVLSFFTIAILLPCSEFLRLGRKSAETTAQGSASFRAPINVAALATSETCAVLATGLVLYFSVNAITHPITLSKQATHLMSWPTEGTLRVISLVLCVCSVSMIRFLRADCGARKENHPT
jgi:hypothetical protein